MLHLCKIIISPWVLFFHFFKILIFCFVRGEGGAGRGGVGGEMVKGQKMDQNDKKFYPLYSISQEPYII